MRYWYLKGGDVSGPLSAQEIAQDSDFSQDILVCPEPNSGDEEYWKTPDMYADDFAPFLGTAPKAATASAATKNQTAPAPKPVEVQKISAPAAQSVAALKAQETAAEEEPSALLSPASKPLSQQEKHAPAHVSPVKEVKVPAAKPLKSPVFESEINEDLLASSPEETIHTQSPFIAAQEDNILEELPAKAVLADEEKAEDKTQPQEIPAAEEQEEEKIPLSKADEPEHPADPLINFIEQQKPLQSFREEDFTLVSAPKEEPKKAAPKKEESEIKQNPDEGTIFKPKQAKSSPVVIKPAAKAPADVPAEPKELKPQPQQTQKPKTITPAETFSAGSGVVHIKQDGEDVPPVNEKPKEAKQEKSFFSSMSAEKTATVNAGTTMPFPFGEEIDTASVSELIEEEPSSPFLQVDKQGEHNPHARRPQDEEDDEPLIPVAQGERLAGGIMPTTNGKIISSSDGRLEEKKPKNDVMYLLIISMFVFTGIALFMTFFGDKGKDDKKQVAAPQKQEAEVKPVVQGVKEGVVSPEVSLAQNSALPANPNPIKTSEISYDKGAMVQSDNESNKIKAQDIVRRYLLDEQRGTIGEYFNRTYTAAGYQTRWTANPFYTNIYVVEFTATKVRSEPIVYQFNVDVQKGVVQHGLNGISMDLLGAK